MARLAHPPRCLALIPCQEAKKDPTSGLWSITNTFTEMQIDGLPMVMAGFDVFVTLGRGGGSEVDTVHMGLIAPDGTILHPVTFDTNWGVHQVTELAVPLRAIKFTTAGDYTLRLFVEGLVLAERTITIKDTTE